jgi:translation initiation factor 2 subunit 1
MSYYGNDFPEPNETVFVQLESFSEHGLYCRLIEYGNKEGFLLYSELEKRVYYDKYKYFNFKKVYPMTVLAVDPRKGQIDLSHRKIKANEREKNVDDFQSVSKIYRLTEEFSELTGIPHGDVLQLTMYQIMKKDELDNSHKKLKSILQRPKSFIDNVKRVYPSESEEYLDSLSSRITSTTRVICQNFNLTVYSDDAINEIKKLLSFPDIDQNVKIEYVNSPTYRIIVECKLDDETNELIDDYVEMHKINKRQGMCNQSDFAKLGPDVSVDDINKYIGLIKERTKNKNVTFELKDKYLFKDREISIKYLPKSQSNMSSLLKRNNSSNMSDDSSSKNAIEFYSDSEDNNTQE